MTTGAISTRDGYATFVLAVDDLEWTKPWLGRLRCDQLVVRVAARDGVRPRIRLSAVESKTTTSIDPVALSPNSDPFAEGVDQAVATLEALGAVSSPAGPDPLVEDLRFAAFIEHLTSIALSEVFPVRASDQETLYVLRTISDLSLRTMEAEAVELDGAVVCTQYRAAVPSEAARCVVNRKSRLAHHPDSMRQYPGRQSLGTGSCEDVRGGDEANACHSPAAAWAGASCRACRRKWSVEPKRSPRRPPLRKARRSRCPNRRPLAPQQRRHLSSLTPSTLLAFIEVSPLTNRTRERSSSVRRWSWFPLASGRAPQSGR